MAAKIYQLPTQVPGMVGVLPNPKFMVTGDNLATVTTAGYLNQVSLEQNPVAATDVIQILYSFNLQTQSGTYGVFSVSISNGVITLALEGAAGEVTLPTIANHIATYTNVSGNLSEDPATAISGGNIQAGLSGTAGTLASFPGTASKGSLVVAAVANTGNTLTTISNAAMGQASVVSIPDPGVATTNFLLTDSASTQSITTGNLTLTLGNLTVAAGTISASLGNVTAGSSGHAGTVGSFPSGATSGELLLAAVTNSSGNFNTTISNAAAVGQSEVVTVPDLGAASGNFIVSSIAGAGIQHITTGSLEVDAGTLISGIATGGTAGGLTLYPATASNGKLVLAPVGNAGNFAATVSNVSTLGQASVYTLPDPANAAARFLVGAGATPFVSGNFPKNSGTGGLMVDSGFSVPASDASANSSATTIAVPMSSNGSGVLSFANTAIRYAAGSFTLAQILAAYTTPLTIIPAPGAGFMVVIQQFVLELVYGSAGYAGGGAAYLQYGSTAHGTNYATPVAGIPAAVFTGLSASLAIQALGNINTTSGLVTSVAANAPISYTNATAVFTSGSGGTANWYVYYSIVPTT